MNISGTGNLTLNGIAAPASPSPLSNLLYLNASNQVQQTPAGVNVVSGSGTLNTVPLWTPNGNTLGNSLITQPTIAGIAVTPTSAGNALTVNNFSAASTAIKINANGGTGINIDPAGTGIQLDATGTGISFVNSNPTTGINLRAATTGINIAVNPSAWGMDYQGAGLINGGIRILGNSGINTGFQAGSAGSTVTNAFFASATQPAGVLSNGFHATTDQGTITNGVLVDNTLAGTIINGVRVNLVGGNSTNGMRVTNGGAGTITNGLLVENTSTGSITTGIISNNTSLGSLTKAIRASGNSPSTGVAVASNIALQVDQGELTMGRGHDDDAVAGNIAGPSGIINSGIFPVPSAATTGAVPGAPLGGGPTKIKGSNGFFAFNDYVNANSIVLATVINNNPPVVGEAVLGANESVEVRVGRSTNGVTFHISRSCDPVLGPGAGATAGFFRIGYLVINPIR